MLVQPHGLGGSYLVDADFSEIDLDNPHEVVAPVVNLPFGVGEVGWVDEFELEVVVPRKAESLSGQTWLTVQIRDVPQRLGDVLRDG